MSSAQLPRSRTDVTAGTRLPAVSVKPARDRFGAPARSGANQDQSWKRQKEVALGGYPKRICDVVIASVTLVVVLPLLIMLAALVKLTMGGSVIFAHRRVGLMGREFLCYKFRTMVADGDEILRRHLVANPEAAQEWALHQKLVCDPRVTPLGLLMRKASLDELPQLINVIKGEMSCVGPRPIVRDELERYGRQARRYVSARPGLTGLWQVTGRSKIGYRRRVALDACYVTRWSLGLDLLILLRTIPALMRINETN